MAWHGMALTSVIPNARFARTCLLNLRCADGTYATLGSYAVTAVLGRPDLAPTSWRLEGMEPGSTQRQILDEARYLQHCKIILRTPTFRHVLAVPVMKMFRRVVSADRWISIRTRLL